MIEDGDIGVCGIGLVLANFSCGMERYATKETNVAHALHGSKCTGIQCPVFERRENERRRL